MKSIVKSVCTKTGRSGEATYRSVQAASQLAGQPETLWSTLRSGLLTTEEPYPDEAIRLYQRMVQRLIDAHGRENYQQAVGYLTRVKRLFEKQGHEFDRTRSHTGEIDRNSVVSITTSFLT